MSDPTIFPHGEPPAAAQPAETVLCQGCEKPTMDIYITSDDVELCKSCYSEVPVTEHGEGGPFAADQSSRPVAPAAALSPTPTTWVVTRDSFEPPEYFDTEEEANKNACLGVCDTHVVPLYRLLGSAQSGLRERMLYFVRTAINGWIDARALAAAIDRDFPAESAALSPSEEPKPLRRWTTNQIFVLFSSGDGNEWVKASDIDKASAPLSPAAQEKKA